jgi:hypothetical protein
MTMDRRGFLYAGGFAAAAGGALMTAAHAAPGAAASSLSQFGVEVNSDRDQTVALQKAIDELARAGQPLVLPDGSYVVGGLKLAKGSAIIGTPGQTILKAKTGGPVLAGTGLGTFHLSGISFEGPKSGPSVVALEGAAVSIGYCRFAGSATAAIKLENCSGVVEAIEIAGGMGTGISATQAAGLTVTRCRIAACETAGIAVSGAGEAADGFIVGQNHLGGCGIVADGTGIVAGNIVRGSPRFGLKIGKASGSGHLMAQSNMLRGCRIGIGVAASGDDIMASLNMITGAKDGAIRAFDGEKIVGPDLARQSAEAYLNLMVAGNVVR